MIVQYGVLAYDRDAAGALRILLITSRDTGRWVVPRGNPIAGLDPPRSAAREAYEEAGVTGSLGEAAVGAYDYGKRRKNGEIVPARVHLFPLRVLRQSDDWPERHQRTTRWFAPEGAADAVDEPGLKALIRDFRPPDHTP